MLSVLPYAEEQNHGLFLVERVRYFWLPFCWSNAVMLWWKAFLIWCHYRWCLPWRTTKELFRSVCSRRLCPSVGHDWHHCLHTTRILQSRGHEVWSVAIWNCKFDVRRCRRAYSKRSWLAIQKITGKNTRSSSSKAKGQKGEEGVGWCFWARSGIIWKVNLLCQVVVPSWIMKQETNSWLHLMALEWALVRNACPHVPPTALKVLWVKWTIREPLCAVHLKPFQI